MLNTQNEIQDLLREFGMEVILTDGNKSAWAMKLTDLPQKYQILVTSAGSAEIGPDDVIHVALYKDDGVFEEDLESATIVGAEALATTLESLRDMAAVFD